MRQRALVPVDPFGHTDSLDEPVLEVLAGRFEARGEDRRFAGMLEEYLEAMAIDDAARVLDLGCGTGLATRAVARRPGFDGSVVGIDLSAYLVETAARLAREEELDDVTEFRVGDCHNLQLEDAGFDAVVAHTLLSHVDDPAAVLAEAARVLRPGGVLGLFDGDYASLTFDHPDPVRARAYDETLVGAVVANPRVMRRMPRLLRAAGFEPTATFAHVLAETGHADFWASAIEAYRALMVRAGALSEQEADAWASSLSADSEAETFFAATNYYAYVARLP